MGSSRELTLARRVIWLAAKMLGCVVLAMSLGALTVLGPELWVNPDFAGLGVGTGILTVMVLPTFWVLVAQEVRWCKSQNTAHGYGHVK